MWSFDYYFLFDRSIEWFVIFLWRYQFLDVWCARHFDFAHLCEIFPLLPPLKHTLSVLYNSIIFLWPYHGGFWPNKKFSIGTITSWGLRSRSFSDAAKSSWSPGWYLSIILTPCRLSRRAQSFLLFFLND